jgi:SpoVK/Ycf46/Vps4 family AAA+-type ATPase
VKKINIVNLIRYYAEHNDSGFRAQAREIAREFADIGDEQLSRYIFSLMSSDDVFVPQQTIVESDSPFLRKILAQTDMLLLPDEITTDILGIVNAMKRDIGAHKFLFQGPPGTGKTEAAKQLARITGRELFLVDSSALVDSRLGQTQKNLASLFSSINHMPFSDKVMILFDELDAIALDRTNGNDLREMGRVTTEFLRGLDGLNSRIVLLATTNLFKYFDKAVSRRFDFVVDFDRYSDENLADIAERILDRYLGKAKLPKDVRLFRKILAVKEKLPFPAELENLIRTAVAFSDQNNSYNYLRRLYVAFLGNKNLDADVLKSQGFTVREIGILLSRSKSDIGRFLKKEDNHE